MQNTICRPRWWKIHWVVLIVNELLGDLCNVTEIDFWTNSGMNNFSLISMMSFRRILGMESIDDTHLMQSYWSVVRFESFYTSNYMFGILLLKIYFIFQIICLKFVFCKFGIWHQSDNSQQVLEAGSRTAKGMEASWRTWYQQINF